MIEVRHEFFAMGSDCVILLAALPEADALQIARAAEAEVCRIEAKYSRYRNDNELARINRAAMVGGATVVDAETQGLLTFAAACHLKSGGAFDITSGLLRKVWDFKVACLPDQTAIDPLIDAIGMDKVVLQAGRVEFVRPGMELDLGGLGKEYAADRAAEVCRAFGCASGFIDLGGDISVVGPQSCEQPWQIGIRNPRNHSAAIDCVPLLRGGLATSGDYERFIEVGGRRYSHILDPRTGWPADDLGSVTVIAESCLLSGALATSAMVMGRAGSAWLEALGVRHILVDDGGFRRGDDFGL